MEPQNQDQQVKKLAVSLPPGIWQRFVFMLENTHGLPFTPLESIALAQDIAKQCQSQQAITNAADQIANPGKGEKIKLTKVGT